jgi:hypothetical protein
VLEVSGHSPTGIVEGAHVVGFFMDGEAAQQPVIIGTINAKSPEKSSNGGDDTKGFRDPNNIYPRYKKGEAETNRLARGESDKTVVQWRKDNIDEADKAGGGSFKEPETPYAAKYPYNHVRESEPSPGEDVSDKDPPDNSGHIMEFDDTPGAERVYMQHKKGTFLEWHDDGTEVHKVMNERYVVITSDDHLHVSGDGMITIDGNAYIKVGGDATIEVDGNVNETIGGSYTLKVSGDYNVTVGGNHTEQDSGSLTVNASVINLN